MPSAGAESGFVKRLEYGAAHPWLPILLLILLPFAVHMPQWVLPTHSDPIWLFGSMATDFERPWLPGHNFIDPYIEWTTQAIGRVVARDWLHGIVPWWNPYVGVGVPLAGQMQPSAFLLPFVLLLALPGGVTWLIISMQVLMGIATRALLLELRLSPLAALTGGALFALNGTVAWVPGPGAVVCTLAFLPLLLWGIERSRRPDQGPAAVLGIACGIGGSLVAGFPETAYLDGLMGLMWALLRSAQGPFGALVIRRTVVGGVLGLLSGAPLLIAFADEMVGSHLIAQHSFGLGALSIRSWPMLILPAVYGPLNAGTTGTEIYTGWGNAPGYTSALTLFMATLSFQHRSVERGLRWALAGCIVLAVAKSVGFGPVAYVVNLLPAMRDVAFHRYAGPVWELALIILAAFGLDQLRTGAKIHAIWAMSLPLIAVVGAIVEARLAASTNWSSLSNAHQLFWLIVSGILAAGGIGAGFAASKGASANAAAAVAALAVLEAAIMFCLPQASGERGGRLDMAPVRFLAAHAGLSRVVTVGPLSPNGGAYFGFGMLNHNMSPVPQDWLDYIDTQLLPGAMQQDAGATFWPVKRPPLDADSAMLALNQHRAAYQDMDVRYVVTPRGASPAPAMVSPVLDEPKLPLPLAAGQSASITFTAPARSPPIAEIGVMIATYQGASDGDLVLRLCAGTVCRSGRITLGNAADNAIDYGALDAPLQVAPGSALRLQLIHQGGRHSLALWIWPVPVSERSANPTIGDARVIHAPDLPAASGVRVGLRGQDNGGWRQVAAGSAMDVWEMPNPRAYFDAAGCTLAIADRLRVQADCPRASTLIRRELFMAGWQARLNGRAVPIERPVDGIQSVLQQVALPAGRSTVTFGFVPPYMLAGWVAACLALLGIGWQLLQLRQAISVAGRRAAARTSPAANS